MQTKFNIGDEVFSIEDGKAIKGIVLGFGFSVWSHNDYRVKEWMIGKMKENLGLVQEVYAIYIKDRMIFKHSDVVFATLDELNAHFLSNLQNKKDLL